MLLFPRYKPTTGTELTCSVLPSTYAAYQASDASNNGKLFSISKEIFGQWWANAKELEHKVTYPNPFGDDTVFTFNGFQYTRGPDSWDYTIQNASKYSFPRAFYQDGAISIEQGLGSNFVYYDPDHLEILELPTMFMWQGSWLYYNAHGNPLDTHEHELTSSLWTRVRKNSSGATIVTYTTEIKQTYH